MTSNSFDTRLQFLIYFDTHCQSIPNTCLSVTPVGLFHLSGHHTCPHQRPVQLPDFTITVHLRMYSQSVTLPNHTTASPSPCHSTPPCQPVSQQGGHHHIHQSLPLQEKSSKKKLMTSWWWNMRVPLRKLNWCCGELGTTDDSKQCHKTTHTPGYGSVSWHSLRESGTPWHPAPITQFQWTLQLSCHDSRQVRVTGPAHTSTSHNSSFVLSLLAYFVLCIWPCSSFICICNSLPFYPPPSTPCSPFHTPSWSSFFSLHISKECCSPL